LKIGNSSQKRINQGKYNRFNGSLKFLQKLTSLKELDISNTDLDKGVEYLPVNLRNQKGRKKFFYSTEFRSESKLKKIVGQLTNFLEYGLCKKCQKTNIGHNWCQLCDSKINQDIHEFTQEKNLESVSYEKFVNIKYLAKGGFGEVYKARQKEKKGKKEIVLKILDNSRGTTSDFLKEIASHKLLSSDRVVKCLGVSQDPNTKNLIMIMNYIKDAEALKEIHEQGLIHRDLHPGNILNRKDIKATNFKRDVKCIIADLGLCRPANEIDQGKIYGVLPYVAPEVLRGKKYTQASDIYSFGIIACEILSGIPPYTVYDEKEKCYKEVSHDLDLTIAICNGLRPLFRIKIPQLLKDLIKQC
ncbi:kinase-like domain-containing protein, partial [Glomus cerebriforme]